MLQVNHLTGFGSQYREPAKIEYRNNYVTGSGTSNFNFTNCDFGVESTDRHIIVALSASHASGTITLNSITIGGISASIYGLIGTTGSKAAIAIAAVPTGTTGTVNLTWSGTVNRPGIGVYRATGLFSAIPYDVQSTSTVTSNALSVNINGVPGFIVGVGHESTNLSLTATWTGVTENYDREINTGRSHTGASENLITTDDNRLVRVQYTPTPGSGALLVAASFR